MAPDIFEPYSNEAVPPHKKPINRKPRKAKGFETGVSGTGVRRPTPASALDCQTKPNPVVSRTSEIQ